MNITVYVRSVIRDGLPDMQALVGRVAFLWDGNLVSGWPVDRVDDEGVPIWEADSDVGRHGVFNKVTHWIEFPVSLWELEGDSLPK